MIPWVAVQNLYLYPYRKNLVLSEKRSNVCAFADVLVTKWRAFRLTVEIFINCLIFCITMLSLEM